MPKSTKQSFKVLAPYIKYVPDRIAMQGEIVDDIPTVSAPWLVADGLIEPVGSKTVTTEGDDD